MDRVSDVDDNSTPGNDGGNRDAAMQELALSEARYRALVEGSSDFIYVLDPEGNFSFANAEVGHLLGYSPDEIIGRHYSEFLVEDDADRVGRAFHERRTGDRATRRLEVRLKSRGGATRDVEMDLRHFSISAHGLYRGGSYIGTHGVARDITERKFQELKRGIMQRVREAVWSMITAEDIQNVLEAIREGLDDMGVSYEHCAVNVVDATEPPMLRSYSSYGSSGISKRGEWMITESEGYASRIYEIWRRGRTARRVDLQVLDTAGELVHLTELFGPVRCVVDLPFSFGTLTILSGAADAFSDRDVSFFEELSEALSEGFRRMEDLQELSRSEKRYRTLVETPNFVVMLLDADGNYLYVSPQVEQWLGHTPEDFYRSPGFRREIVHPDDFEATKLFHEVSEPEHRSLEFRWRHRDGRYLWAAGSVFPIYENAEDEQIHNVSMVQVVAQDITERKEAEDRIRASLLEKEVLLKEIHHRVKNNLQIISSLLHLQASRFDGPGLQMAFDDSQHRIRSMALIHEELYKSEDLARVDFRAYAQRLAENLLDSFGVRGRVVVRLDMDATQLTIERSIPMGLIVNELVSNSLKYAFPDERQGHIRIELRLGRESDAFSLAVIDDGVGLPEGLDIDSPESLGLQLVGSLVGQLKARLVIDEHGEGAGFHILRSA
jgi:PAS domain S-box-containing protein